MEIKEKIEKIKQNLKLPQLKEDISLLEKESASPEFWQDHLQAGKKMQQLSDKQKIVEELEFLEMQINEWDQISEKDQKQIQKQIKKLEIQTYLSGKYDYLGAILSLHAGQGGTEAMDWTEMLLRMYLRYAENKHWSTEVVQQTDGEEAGIKSVTVEITGQYTYGLLRKEHGTHRLIRLSPFNADHLRQTSFALVEVSPLIENDLDIELNPGEIEFQTFRASGPGGQHVNKTESAVRAIHQPTGLTVSVSSSRSQLKNRKTALQLLRGKLVHLMEEQQVEKINQIKGDYKPASWGNQIRTYTLEPYQLVKDHRTNHETSQAEKVLDGDLEEFIQAEIAKIEK